MRNAIALAVVLALSAPAAAAEETRSFIFAYDLQTAGIRMRIEACLPQWAAAIPGEMQKPSGWDDAKAGPFDVVRNHLRLRTEWGPVATVRVVLVLDDPGLPSASDAADRIGLAVVSEFQARVEGLSVKQEAAERERLDAETAEAAAAAKLADFDLAEFEAKWGEPASDLASVAARLSRVEGDFAQTKIDHAVAAKKLEVARAGAERAREVRRLEEQLREAEEALKAAPPGMTTHEAALAAVRKVREVLAEATAHSPSLETARERVAEIEVELVAEECRESLLTAELDELRARRRYLLARVREHADLVRAREAPRARLAALATARQELQARGRRPRFELIRPLGPEVPERR